ncbi:MAG: exo-alpha-sialidase [Proteobacteria bacterium]|nr:exo-alpha-sialidase [Pseudomonadota bacterium]
MRHFPDDTVGTPALGSLMRLFQCVRWVATLGWLVAAGSVFGGGGGGVPAMVSEALFPPEARHNHASCIVEAADGTLFVAWFNGSGERQADDVKLQASRRRSGARAWEPRFTLWDTPGFPDCNPSLHVDGQGRLWLFHAVVLANTWESTLLQARVSGRWRLRGPVRWDGMQSVLLAPGEEFLQILEGQLPRLQMEAARPDLSLKERQEVTEFIEGIHLGATNRLYRRLGWMPRAHLTTVGGRWMLPLYHDGYSVSMVALSDDQGRTWRPSSPIVGLGNVQPSLTVRRDGTVVAWMRDNGPPPHRLLRAESYDRGETWTPAVDSGIPNPGSGAEVRVLRSGEWIFIGNDCESGRHSLAVWISEDEGETWPIRRQLAGAAPGQGSFSYPSLLESRDGGFHATWSEALGGRETIRHARFNRAWVRASVPAP